MLEESVERVLSERVWELALLPLSGAFQECVLELQLEVARKRSKKLEDANGVQHLLQKINRMQMEAPLK